MDGLGEADGAVARGVGGEWMRRSLGGGESGVCLGRWAGTDMHARVEWSETSGGTCSLPDSSLPVSFPRSMVCSLLPTDTDTLPK